MDDIWPIARVWWRKGAHRLSLEKDSIGDGSSGAPSMDKMIPDNRGKKWSMMIDPGSLPYFPLLNPRFSGWCMDKKWDIG